MKNKKIGIYISQSLLNKKEIVCQIKKMQKNNTIIIVSDFCVSKTNENRFLSELNYVRLNNIKTINKNEIFDIFLILPCDENMLPQLSNNIINISFKQLIKKQLLYDQPIVLGIYANDGLSSNAENIGKLLNRKNYYFIPFKQPNPITKPYFVSCDENYIEKTIECALNGKQIQPILLSL